MVRHSACVIAAHSIRTLKSQFRLVLTDGSTIQHPGSKGTTWRLHTQWNLGTGRWEHVELTDAHGAESLTRLRLRSDDVVLADRNYAKPPALAGDAQTRSEDRSVSPSLWPMGDDLIG